MYREVFDRLPQNYSKEGQINNEKFHKVVFGGVEKLRNVFEDIRDSKDIDRAFGKSLDNLGRNVQELRSSDDDNIYRQFIKTKIIANRSRGDIETLNTVADFLLGDKFLGFKESWGLEGYGDVAGLVGEFKLSLNSFPYILDRVKSGGVKLYWEATAVDNLIKLKTLRKSGLSDFPLCNTIEAGTWWYQQNLGRVKQSTIAVESNTNKHLFDYPETALTEASEKLYQYYEFATQLTIDQVVTLREVLKSVHYDYVKANEVLSGEYPDILNAIKSINNGMELGSEVRLNVTDYPITGEYIAKESD